MGRLIESLAKLTLANAGHKNVTVNCASLGATSDFSVKAGYESAGTWAVSSDRGEFSF